MLFKTNKQQIFNKILINSNFSFKNHLFCVFYSAYSLYQSVFRLFKWFLLAIFFLKKTTKIDNFLQNGLLLKADNFQFYAILYNFVDIFKV